MQSSTGTPVGGVTDQDAIDFIRSVFGLVRSGDDASLRAMVEKGLPVNFRNEKGDSLIMLASYHGHLDTCRVLLQAGADPNVPNDQGQTPLAGAAYKGFVEIAELLLAHGANIEGASPDGKTPLMMAAMFNRTAIVELEAGPVPTLEGAPVPRAPLVVHPGQGLDAMGLAGDLQCAAADHAGVTRIVRVSALAHRDEPILPVQDQAIPLGA